MTNDDIDLNRDTARAHFAIDHTAHPLHDLPQHTTKHHRDVILPQIPSKPSKAATAPAPDTVRKENTLYEHELMTSRNVASNHNNNSTSEEQTTLALAPALMTSSRHDYVTVSSHDVTSNQTQQLPCIDRRGEGIVSRLTTSTSAETFDLDPVDDLEHLQQGQSSGVLVSDKMAREERALRRKRILDNEPPTLYGRDERGNVVPLQGTFKRRSFSVPTTREQRVRRQVLLQVRDKQQRTMRRVRTFMDKIEAEKGYT